MAKRNLIIFFLALMIFVFSGIASMAIVISGVTINEVIEYKEIVIEKLKE